MPRKAKSSKGGERKRALSSKVPPRLSWLRQQAAALLADQVVFNICRKVVQEMQHPTVQGLLQM